MYLAWQDVIGPHWRLFDGADWVPLDATGPHWIHWSHRIALASFGITYGVMGPRMIPLDALGFNRVPLDSMGFHWI